MKAFYLPLLATAILTISFSLIRQESTVAPAPTAPFFNGVFPDSIARWELKPAADGRTFTLPMWVENWPYGGVLVTERKGRIWLVDSTSGVVRKRKVLDLRNTTFGQGDSGMFDIAVHPEFGVEGSPNKHYVYLTYNYLPEDIRNTGDNTFSYHRVSRFTYLPEENILDPDSELVMIQQFDHDWLHSGGSLFFDNEGFLNISIGDGGFYYPHGQSLTQRLYGGILRIDVDKNAEVSHPIRKRADTPEDIPEGWPGEFFQEYYIPNTNPWLDPAGTILEEFVIIGLRNPHTTWYDPLNDEIWVGDVGAATREELSVMKRGDNGQWPYQEGTQAGIRAKPAMVIGNERPPVFDYGRSFGRSIIAGFLYRGERYPELNEQFIFGDFSTHGVWAFDRRDSSIQHLLDVSIHENTLGMISFYPGNNGEIFLTYARQGSSDQLMEIVPTGTIEINAPKTLSGTGVFQDLATLEPTPHFLPYSLNAGFYSDYALKKRWVALPNDGQFNSVNEQVVVMEDLDLSFPNGTVFIKHFDLPLDANDPTTIRRLETRFLVLTSDQGAYGLTYQWNEEGTEAYLLSEGETVTYPILNSRGEAQLVEWTYPSQQECMSCHRRNASFVLGPQLPNLHKLHDYDGTGLEQLNLWNDLNIFREELSDTYISAIRKAVALEDPMATSEEKVRSYLDTNCSFCHQPNGVSDPQFDARMVTPLHEAGILNVAVSGRQSVPGNDLIATGDTTRSEMLRRIQATNGLRMPPIGSNQVDTVFEAVLKDWILKAQLLTQVPQQASGWSIFPNPITDHQLTIQSEHPQTFDLVLFDLSGQRLFAAHQISNGPVNLPLSLSPGLYLLTVTAPDQVPVTVKVSLAP